MRKYTVFSHQGTLVELSDGLNRQCAGLNPRRHSGSDCFMTPYPRDVRGAVYSFPPVLSEDVERGHEGRSFEHPHGPEVARPNRVSGIDRPSIILGL